MSPFIYAHPFYNGQGFYGLQNLNLVFNLNAGAAGLWRCMDNDAYVNGSAKPLYAVGSSPVISEFKPSESRLIFNFLTPKPSDLLAARNVVPYWEMPRYLKSAAIAAIAVEQAYKANASGVAPNAISYTPIQSQSLQLNQVPDKLIVFFRTQQDKRTAFTSDRTMIINRISINWNNQSGILASATQDQLWRFSVEAGSIQSWQEFSGVYNDGKPQSQQAAPGNAGGNQFDQLVPTVGSYLMLDFAKHINITEDYYAPGSLGNFNLQFTVDVGTNNREASAPMDMVIITVNSGLFVTEKGQSATYTGILTKDDVLSAAAMKPVSDAEARRLVGGLNIGSLLNTAGKVAKGIQKYSGVADAAVGLLPEGKLKSGLQTGLNFAKKGADVASKFSGEGMRGRGRGSQVFNIQDRLV
jgi:hypothetical protein